MSSLDHVAKAAKAKAISRGHLRRALGDLLATLMPEPDGEPASRITPDRGARLRRLAAVLVFGGAVLGLVTLVTFDLGFNFATAAFAFLIALVLLALLDSLIASAIFSLAAFACLGLLFVEPLYTWRVERAQDVMALVAFLIASLVVTGLVRGVRRERVRLLGLTHRQAEDAVKTSEQRYRHLFQHLPFALAQCNATRLNALFDDLRAEGVTDFPAYLDQHPEFLDRAMDALVVDEVNERTVQMFGARSAADLVGPVGRFWQMRPDTFRRIVEARFRGEQHFEEETKMLTLDGRVIDVHYTGARVGSPASAGISLVGLIDITERVRARERLQQVQADFAHAARISTLGELLASMAHELNQPLTAIALSGEAGLRWISRPEPDLNEARKLTMRMIADARRSADIIARIRVMAVRRSPEQAPVSLDDLVREALLFLRHEVQSRAVVVSHFRGPEGAKVLADRTQLQQVIVNLALNAMQAAAHARDHEPRITIRIASPDVVTVCCTVEDSGPGIEPRHFPRLFDSFFTTKESGMGMGLSVCRSIIEAHGGRISADNESVHGGARFSFILPAAQQEHEVYAADPAGVVPLPASRPRQKSTSGVSGV